MSFFLKRWFVIFSVQTWRASDVTAAFLGEHLVFLATEFLVDDDVLTATMSTYGRDESNHDPMSVTLLSVGYSHDIEYTHYGFEYSPRT